MAAQAVSEQPAIREDYDDAVFWAGAALAGQHPAPAGPPPASEVKVHRTFGNSVRV